MEKEPFYRDDDQAILIALFRYGVIAQVADRDDFATGEVMALVRQVAGATHFLPGTGPVRVSERTVFAWLKAYRKGGIEALRPRIRKDRGSSRVLTEELVARAVQLRKEGPERWTTTLLDILEREGALGGRTIPHRATLDSHLARQGASRRQMGILAAKRTIRCASSNSEISGSAITTTDPWSSAPTVGPRHPSWALSSTTAPGIRSPIGTT